MYPKHGSIVQLTGVDFMKESGLMYPKHGSIVQHTLSQIIL